MHASVIRYAPAQALQAIPSVAPGLQRAPRPATLSLRQWLAYLAILLAGLAFAPKLSGSEPRKVILDDDGFNIAQWLVVKAPGVKVVGVTEVSGNAWRDANVARALRGLELLDATQVPVVPGAVYPLLNSERQTERWESLYGKLIWKGAWMKRWVEETEQPLPAYHAPDVVPELPEGNPKTRPADEIAANFLIRKVREFPGEISIIATGPLTNLALAQSLDPEFARLAKELVYMGGSLNPQQRLTSIAAQQFAREFVNTPRHEFNFFFDPEAARIALRAPWRRIVMVPVDPSNYTELRPDLLAAMAPGDSLAAKTLRAHIAGLPLWDEIATAVWLDPTLIVRQKELYVDVVTDFGANYGNTLSWSQGYQPGLGERAQTVVLQVDVERLEARMVEWLSGGDARP